MSPLRIVVEIVLAVAIACALVTAWAAPVGEVTATDGNLLAIKADGRTLALALASPVDAGDTLVTGAGARATLRFADGAVISLRPDSRFAVREYAFQEAAPEKDRSSFELLRGGLRALTGFIGKRGSRDAWALKASTATIGIRGTEFGVQLCLEAGACAGLVTLGGRELEDGIHFDVGAGAIGVANGDGPTVEFAAGSFGVVRGKDGRPERRDDGFRDRGKGDGRTCSAS